MNRLETYFEKIVDKLLRGNWENRVKKISWATLTAIVITLFLLINAAHLKIPSQKGVPSKKSLPIWKAMLGNHQ